MADGGPHDRKMAPYSANSNAAKARARMPKAALSDGSRLSSHTGSVGYSQRADDQVLALQVLADQELALQVLALHVLADQELADQLLALQLLADHELPVHVLPFQTPPDQEFAPVLDQLSNR